MSELPYKIELDLKEAVTMAESLNDYILSDQLYGSAGGGLFGSGNMPSLTLGALLMRLRRLDALRGEMSDKQQAQLDSVIDRHAYILNEWRLHYEGKLTKEANSRLDAIRPFFQECRENPRLCHNVYRPEALRRTIVQEVLTQMDAINLDTDEIVKKARGIDSELRGILKVHDFLWDKILQSIYPADTFWWLYRLPENPDA